MSVQTDQYILAVDLGTSGPKVALFSASGALVAHDFEPTPLQLLPNGGAEQNPEDWWNAITRATQRVVARQLVPVDAIRAISLTTQWSGTVAVDRAGQPLRPAIIWMDSRGAPYIKKLTGGFPEIEGYNAFRALTWINLTGGIPGKSGKDPIAHILYLQNKEPQVYRQAYKFMEPKDYLNLRLTGRFAASYDSITLHWVTDNRNIQKIDYDPRLLRWCTVERDQLPDLQPPAGILGPVRPEVAREWGLREDVLVGTGTPDMFSAAVGSGAVHDYQAHLYLGTSSWLMCHVPFKKTDLAHSIPSLPAAIPGRYILTDEQETAGACLNYLRDNIFCEGGENVYREFDRIAARVPPGSGGLIFTPWLYGERTPVEDDRVRSGFFNQSLRTTREEMIRSVFEGVALNTRWMLGPVEQFIGRQVGAINMVGGGANSDLWCQIYADVLDRPIRQIKDPTLVNARGAAFLGAVALGCLTFDDIPSRVEIARTYAPNPDNRRLYDELFREFVSIYHANKKIYARLNRRSA